MILGDSREAADVTSSLLCSYPFRRASLLAHMRARPGSLPISGTSDREGQRVWFLYTHVQSNTEKAFIRQRLIGRLDEIGERLAGIDRTGAHAYLYRFGN